MIINCDQCKSTTVNPTNTEWGLLCEDCIKEYMAELAGAVVDSGEI